MVNCKIYEPKGLGVEVWKLINRRPDFDTDQNPQVFNPAVQQDEPFLVKFDGFLREYLDNAEIKITIYDQADATLAYHYVSLRHLYLASKKGHDVWLCMTLKEQNGSKFPLLHLKVKSHFSEKLHRLPTIIKEQPVYDKDFIEDSFFSYKFKMPLITPKQTHILECLPKDWGVLDEATKSLLRNNEFGKYIQRIKYNLFRNYHQNTSRQLARLKHSAYTWAELQDELAAYEPPQTQDKSQIWISEDYIKNLTTPKKPQFGDEDINAGADHSGAAANGTEFSGVISYLFKRDKWESKEEWKTVMGSYDAKNDQLADTFLWYDHKDSKANFEDKEFYNFGGWQYPSIKLFDTGDICDIKVDTLWSPGQSYLETSPLELMIEL